MARNGLKPLATGPAHRRRMCVHALTAPIFPYAGIGFERELRRLLAERLDRVKQRGITRVRQPAIEKHRRRRHDYAAVDVVLALIDRRVSNAHRSIPAISGKRRSRSLLEHIGMYNPVERPHLFGAARGDAKNIRYEVFHGSRSADAIQCAHDKEGVPHPTKTIVPIASRSWHFGNRRGQRRYDRAGFLVIAQFERDARADNLVLPVDGEGKAPHPLEPIVAGAFAEIAARRFERALKWLIGAENQMHRPRQHERSLVLDVREWR